MHRGLYSAECKGSGHQFVCDNTLSQCTVIDGVSVCDVMRCEQRISVGMMLENEPKHKKLRFDYIIKIWNSLSDQILKFVESSNFNHF